MTDERGVLRAISWRDLCPWLIIFRAFSVSTRVSVLCLSTVAVLITPLGWLAGEMAFIPARQHDGEFGEVANQLGGWPTRRATSAGEAADYQSPKQLIGYALQQPGEIESVFWRYAEPWRQLFNSELSLRQFAYFLFGGLWTLLVWSLFGGAITRIAAVQLGREERVGFREAIIFVARRLVSYVAAPLFPLLGVVVIALPMAALGLIMTWDIGVVVASILWVFVLIGGLIIAVFLLGQLFGWPLMWATISSEGTDAFDAVSRAFAYTFGRPLHYLFYAFVAVVFGSLAWLLVHWLTEGIIQVGYWGASWGSNVATVWDPDSADAGRMSQIRRAVEHNEASDETLQLGAWVIGLLVGLVRAIASGFAYSFFWCVATAVYLLLRRDVDQTEFDEVYLEDETEADELPTQTTDSAGVPGLADENKNDESQSERPADEQEGQDGDGKQPESD